MVSRPDNTTERPRTAGLLAEFGSPGALRDAAGWVREAGYTRWDTHSPFPVHGMERAMGIRATPLPWLVLAAGIGGGLAALLMQWWMNAVDYPLVISGKPLFSLPANIPIMFELIVLVSALAAFGGVLVLNRLPQFTHFVHRQERFRRATTDGFFISIEATDPAFDESATTKLLESLGATAVELCPAASGTAQLPRMLTWGLTVACVLALLPPLLIALARQQKSDKPRIHILQDMDFQPKYKTQSYSPFFADHRSMRPTVAGAVAVGQPYEDTPFHLGYISQKDAVDGPDGNDPQPDREYCTELPVKMLDQMPQWMERGRQRFAVFCATCHGLVGDGQGITSLRALRREELDWVTPVSFHKDAVRKQPVGELFSTVTNGIRKMPSYGSQIPLEDRWAIVMYVRALQRSQNAGLEDVPQDRRDQLR